MCGDVMCGADVVKKLRCECTLLCVCVWCVNDFFENARGLIYRESECRTEIHLEFCGSCARRLLLVVMRYNKTKKYNL